MSATTGIQTILQAEQYFKTQGSGYKSWGHVNVLQIALRTDSTHFLLTDENKQLNKLSEKDIAHVQFSSNPTFIQQVFEARKKIQVILVTQQQYASQVKREIPPILDDQAQLLGVSVKVASSLAGVPKALKSRFAAILPDGKSICIGTSLDEAYVAAQLLEKASKVFIEAGHIGGARPINRIEAWLMQQYYQLKYSREAVKNR